MKNYKFVFVILMFLVAMSQTACSSFFKRRECESTNWYNYGQKVALSGRRLTGDQFVMDCRKVEAEIREADLDNGFKEGMARYCEADQVFSLGKSGEKFSLELCDGSNPRVLLDRHSAGVKEYCQKTNGYSAGAAGKPYNGICPKDLEPAFRPEFNRGRKNYLNVVILENERKISSLETEIASLQGERNLKQFQSQSLLSPTMVMERVLDPSSGTFRDQWVSKVTDQQRHASDDMRWQAQRIDADIGSKRNEQSLLRDRNREMQIEIVSLDDRGV